MATAAIVALTRRTRLVERFAWIVLGYFVFVVLLGAVVRATESGGGCGASWPLCNGYVFPLHHPRLATVIEFSHRSSSGVSVILCVILGFWAFWRTPPRHRARRAVSWAGFLLFTEALLGAALVLNHWVEHNISTGRTIAQSIHFTNTLLLMAALALTAWFLRDEETDEKSTVPVRPAIAWTAVLSTIIVGATGSLAALADTLFPSPTLTAGMAQDFAARAPTLVRMRWMHPAAAILGLVCALLMVRSQPRQDGVSGAVIALLILQFLLGPLDILLLAPTWLQILHLLGADLYWIALVVLAARILWPPASTRPGQPVHA